MMIRLLTTIFVRNSIPRLTNQIIKYNYLLTNNIVSSYFSTEKQHPLI